MPTPTSSHITGPPLSKPSRPASFLAAYRQGHTLWQYLRSVRSLRWPFTSANSRRTTPFPSSYFPSHPSDNIEQVGKGGPQGLGKSKSDPNLPASCLSRRFLGSHSLTGPMRVVRTSWISGTTILAWDCHG